MVQFVRWQNLLIRTKLEPSGWHAMVIDGARREMHSPLHQFWGNSREVLARSLVALWVAERREV